MNPNYTESDIRGFITDELSKREFYNQINPSPIPVHTHNGTDSVPVAGENLALIDSVINNATTARHGFLPKLSGSATDALLGTGVFGPFSSTSTPTVLYTDNFGAGTRIGQTTVNTGSFSFGTSGMVLNTGATAASYARGDWTVGDGTGNAFLFRGSPVFTCSFTMQVVPTTGSLFMGIGAVTVAGTGHTFTSNHIGWKVTCSGTIATLSATQADGTESASSLDVLVANDIVECIAIVTGTTSVTYYYRKNGGASLVGPVTLTTNIPTTATDTLRFSMANDNTAIQFKGCVNTMSYYR